MDQEKELLPMRDPQQKHPVCFCAVCGREVYGVGGACSYCARFFP